MDRVDFGKHLIQVMSNYMSNNIYNLYYIEYSCLPLLIIRKGLVFLVMSVFIQYFYTN